MNMMKTHGYDSLDYILYQMRKIFLVLEDVYSVSTVTEIQEAIDAIGTGAGTIFIASGTYEIATPIDIDNCGSLVIYGHGDNTILKANDGVTIFNITCTQRCLIRTLNISFLNLCCSSISFIAAVSSGSAFLPNFNKLSKERKNSSDKFNFKLLTNFLIILLSIFDIST